MEKYYKINRARWNELVAIHAQSEEYDLEGFIAGNNSLHKEELDILGNVKGKSLLHLTAQVTEQIPWRLTRLQFIDFARGMVMVLMAWDHASNFWNQVHGGSEGIFAFRNPDLNLVWTLARFVTHYAAPTFVFLSGVSIALSVHKRLSRGDSQRDIKVHIIIRGLLLLVFEARARFLALHDRIG